MAAAIANVAGIQQLFHYDAYGNLLNLTSDQAATAILYSGQMLDANTGLYNNRARWYDPQIGRFTQLDSFFGNMQDPQSLHKYLYGGADPVNQIDPSGQFFIGIMIALMGALGENAWALGQGAMMTTVIMTGVQLGAMTRESALALIADGDFDFGFFMYDLATRILSVSLDAIETIDTAMGIGQMAGSLIWAGVAVGERFPGIADDVIGGRRAFSRGSVRAQIGLVPLASRAAAFCRGSFALLLTRRWPRLRAFGPSAKSGLEIRWWRSTLRPASGGHGRSCGERTVCTTGR